MAPKLDENSESHNLFKTRGTLKRKVLDVIVDNRSTDNLVALLQKKTW